MISITQKVHLSNYREQSSGGEIQIQEWDRKERTRRAMKTFLLCWGLAIVFIPIPPIHWVAVPGFILAGPIAAAFIFGQEKMITGGEGTCPSCGKPFKIEKHPVKFPINSVCGECHEAVVIGE